MPTLPLLSSALLAALAIAPHPGATPRIVPAARQDGAPAAAVKPLELDYALTIEPGETPLLRCRLTLWNLRGPQTVGLPEGTTYIRLEEPVLQGEVEARTTLLEPVEVERTGAYTWRFDPGEASEVELAWTIPATHRSIPEIAERDAYEWPYVAEDHAFLPSAHLFLVPRSDAGTAPEVESIRVRFAGPTGWAFRAPWEELRPNVFQPASLDALADDLLIAGNWELDGFVSGGMEIRTAFAPGQDALRAAALERIHALVPAQIELFGMVPSEHYLFVFGRPDMSSGYAGSPKTTSMTLCVASDLPADFAAQGLSHLIAHEFFHVWQRARCYVQPDLRFVGEGFTDWFAYRSAARTGLHSDAELLATLERKLATAESTLARLGTTLSEAGGDAFFDGGDAYDATYAGGLVLALALDVGLASRPEAPTLEGLLQALYNDPRWDDAPRGEGPGRAEFLALLEPYAGPELAALVQRTLDQAGRPDLVGLFAAVGLDVERGGTDAAPRYSLPEGTAARILRR